jgi:hypothetical protein
MTNTDVTVDWIFQSVAGTVLGERENWCGMSESEIQLNNHWNQPNREAAFEDNDDEIMATAHKRFNCYLFVQTTVSLQSTPMTWHQAGLGLRKKEEWPDPRNRVVFELFKKIQMSSNWFDKNMLFNNFSYWNFSKFMI